MDAGNKKLKDWQKRDLTALRNLLHDQNFIADVERIRIALYESIDIDQPNNILWLLHKYGLPMGLGRCLSHYLETNKIDTTLIDPSILIVSDKDKTVEPTVAPANHFRWTAYKALDNIGYYQLKLVLTPETTRSELQEFIEQYWHIIEKRRDSLRGTRQRIRTRKNAERDGIIMDMHRQGFNAKQISKRLNADYDFEAIHYVNVRKVISRETRRKTKRDI